MKMACALVVTLACGCGGDLDVGASYDGLVSATDQAATKMRLAVGDRVFVQIELAPGALPAGTRVGARLEPTREVAGWSSVGPSIALRPLQAASGSVSLTFDRAWVEANEVQLAVFSGSNAPWLAPVRSPESSTTVGFVLESLADVQLVSRTP